MDLTHLILRLTSLFRRRPSKQWLYALLAVAAVAIIVVSLEAASLWPDWLTAERGPRIPVVR